MADSCGLAVTTLPCRSYIPGGHGWHWHVLVPRRYSADELQGLRVGWTEYLRRHGSAPSGGAQYARIDVKRFKDGRHAAAYAAKYAGKRFDGDDREKGRKRYLVPRGLDVGVQRGGALSLDEVRSVAAALAAVPFESAHADDWQGPPMVWCTW